MLEFEFWIDGKKVLPDNVGNVLEGAILDAVREKLAKKLEHVQCPEHHEFPHVTVFCTGFSDMKFTVKGCCDKLKNEAVEALR